MHLPEITMNAHKTVHHYFSVILYPTVTSFSRFMLCTYHKNPFIKITNFMLKYFDVA